MWELLWKQFISYRSKQNNQKKIKIQIKKSTTEEYIKFLTAKQGSDTEKDRLIRHIKENNTSRQITKKLNIILKN